MAGVKGKSRVTHQEAIAAVQAGNDVAWTRGAAREVVRGGWIPIIF